MELNRICWAWNPSGLEQLHNAKVDQSRPYLSWPVLLVARARPSDPLQRCELCFKSLHENSAWKCCIKFSLIHHSSKGRGFLWESLVQPLLWWRIPEETTSIHDFSNINHQQLKLCACSGNGSIAPEWHGSPSNPKSSLQLPIQSLNPLWTTRKLWFWNRLRSPQDWFRFPLITTWFSIASFSGKI